MALLWKPKSTWTDALAPVLRHHLHPHLLHPFPTGPLQVQPRGGRERVRDGRDRINHKVVRLADADGLANRWPHLLLIERKIGAVLGDRLPNDRLVVVRRQRDVETAEIRGDVHEPKPIRHARLQRQHRVAATVDDYRKALVALRVLVALHPEHEDVVALGIERLAWVDHDDGAVES